MSLDPYRNATVRAPPSEREPASGAATVAAAVAAREEAAAGLRREDMNAEYIFENSSSPDAEGDEAENCVNEASLVIEETIGSGDLADDGEIRGDAKSASTHVSTSSTTSGTDSEDRSGETCAPSSNG
jgi:hypothetical protein